MAAWSAFVIVFVLALGLSIVLTPLAIGLGKRYRIIALAGGRHQTEGDKRGVPKLGGLPLFVSFAAAALVAQLLPVPRLDPYEVIRLAGLLLGSMVIFIVGLLDDLFHFRALPQFLGQFAAAAVAIIFQIFIEYVNNPLSGQQTEPWPYIVTVALSFFWLVGMMNTVNWLDGLDGLAAGMAFIAGTMLFVNSAFRVEPPQTSVSLLHLALMGSSLGFLLYNFYPARIFMGGGAMLLGYLLGTLSIIGGAKMATILLVMGLPLMDVAWQVLNRVWQGRSPFEGDRGHVHFRLLDLGFSQRQIVLVYYLFCAFFGLLTLVIESQFYKFIALAVMLGLVALGFVFVSRSRQTDSSRSS
ncbi:MAG: undecaprenyl/decaprenyl-phosphate alpha-N-acetylglucosaminyl 1-phosphate transferase [Chloroflexi bacterium]|nr:undecaprenyl/decaprenyl-phosphate alpha-N-acetylglucosaminyl 1-phosphate transferase [Chloroflexota bacterium]